MHPAMDARRGSMEQGETMMEQRSSPDDARQTSMDQCEAMMEQRASHDGRARSLDGAAGDHDGARAIPWWSTMFPLMDVRHAAMDASDGLVEQRETMTEQRDTIMEHVPSHDGRDPTLLRTKGQGSACATRVCSATSTDTDASKRVGAELSRWEGDGDARLRSAIWASWRKGAWARARR